MPRRETLFELGPAIPIERPIRTERAPGALIARPVRNQVEMPVSTLDDRVASDHPVRAIVDIVEGLNLGRFEASVRSNETGGGRPAVAPSVLLALWVYATSQGESRASEIARRIETDDVYRWICGGIPVSERVLADFRARSGHLLQDVLSQVIASLMNEGLIDLHRVAQDGTRVRTWAGADSYRRKETLETLLSDAAAHVQRVMSEGHDQNRSKVAQAAAMRAAKDRADRIARALELVKTKMEGVSDADPSDKKRAPRASTTDAEATRMKMADGGFRPAYNIQFATTADGTGAIVGVSVTNRGNDFGEIAPMVSAVKERTGVQPREWLVDGGYTKKTDIEDVEVSGTSVFGPERKDRAASDGRTARERSAALIAYNARIESPEGKAIYAQRGEVAELANAHAKSRFGLSLLRLRGLAGATILALLAAVTNDVLVLVRERAAVMRTHAASTNPAPIAGA